MLFEIFVHFMAINLIINSIGIFIVIVILIDKGLDYCSAFCNISENEDTF